jgi:hypothetical protein
MRRERPPITVLHRNEVSTMLEYNALAASGEQLTALDDDALATIVGGEGPLSRIVSELVTILWDCVRDGLDDVIDAAKEGYGDAQG